MRRLRLNDLLTCARALLLHNRSKRQAFCDRIVTEARYADRFTRKLGYAHPRWGNGALDAAARQHPLAAMTGLSDPEFRHCLQVILQVIETHHHQGD